jgi:hypothetical protein
MAESGRDCSNIIEMVAYDNRVSNVFKIALQVEHDEGEPASPIFASEAAKFLSEYGITERADIDSVFDLCEERIEREHQDG